MAMSESGISLEHEPLPKKARFESEEQNLSSDVQAQLQADEESALTSIIWTTCCRSLNFCNQLSDKQLYCGLLDAAATLAYVLFDKEELYEMGHSRMLYDQQNKFWDQLEPFAKKRDSVYEVFKWIASTSIDRDAYFLLNECDVADMLRDYSGYKYKKPYMDYIGRGLDVVKSSIDDDILAAIKRAKQRDHRLLENADEYALLLVEMSWDYSVNCQEYLLARAIRHIDVEAFYNNLDADTLQNLKGLNIQSSAHKELDSFIKRDLLELIMRKKHVVTSRLRTSSMAFSLLLNNEFSKKEIDVLREMPPRFPSVLDLNRLAEIRRKAEGSRFINRNHFLWAFNERKCGLHTAFEDQLASSMAGHDHPPYDIYFTLLRLAKAEFVPPNVDHLAYAVIFGKFGSFVEDEEVLEDFKRFMTDMCNLSMPKDLIGVPDYSLLLEDSMKDFKERFEMERGLDWNPFKKYDRASST